MSYYTSHIILLLKEENPGPRLDPNRIAYYLSDHIEDIFKNAAKLFPPHLDINLGHSNNTDKLGYIYSIIAQGMDKEVFEYRKFVCYVFRAIVNVIRLSKENKYNEETRNEVILILLSKLKSMGSIDAPNDLRQSLVDHLNPIANKINDNRNLYDIVLTSQDIFDEEDSPLSGNKNKTSGSVDEELFHDNLVKVSKQKPSDHEKIEVQGNIQTRITSKGQEFTAELVGSKQRVKFSIDPKCVVNQCKSFRKKHGRPLKLLLGKDKDNKYILYNIY